MAVCTREAELERISAFIKYYSIQFSQNDEINMPNIHK